MEFKPTHLTARFLSWGSRHWPFFQKHSPASVLQRFNYLKWCHLCPRMKYFFNWAGDSHVYLVLLPSPGYHSSDSQERWFPLGVTVWSPQIGDNWDTALGTCNSAWSSRSSHGLGLGRRANHWACSSWHRVSSLLSLGFSWQGWWACFLLLSFLCSVAVLLALRTLGSFCLP